MRRIATGLAIALALGACFAGGVRAMPGSLPGGSQSAEYELKAAYLFNFVKFVEWPEEAFSDGSDPVRLCVYGSDPFERALAEIDGRSVRDRRLVAEQVRRAPQVDRCHLLFIPRREFRSTPDLLERVSRSSVLTVTEFEEGDHPRGIINLVRREGRIVMQVAPGRAEVAGLRISSRLLQLAEVVGNSDRGAN